MRRAGATAAGAAGEGGLAHGKVRFFRGPGRGSWFRELLCWGQGTLRLLVRAGTRAWAPGETGSPGPETSEQSENRGYV